MLYMSSAVNKLTLNHIYEHTAFLMVVACKQPVCFIYYHTHRVAMI